MGSKIAGEPYVVRRDRVLPQKLLDHERAVPLSLLDATTANFGLTSAVWLIERPSISLASLVLADHLRESLSITLNSYPQWCGQLKSINTVEDGSLPPETAQFPVHAKRYGRVYVHYGTHNDPGVELVEATSTTTVESLYSDSFTTQQPIWNRRQGQETLSRFVAPTGIKAALEPNQVDADGLYRPAMAIQFTALACGGFILAVKLAHPLADIAALTHFMRDWAHISRAKLEGACLPVLNPVFDPMQLDEFAEGDINAADAEPNIMKDALSLPLHRYDWWAPPAKPPSLFPHDLTPAGKPLPWEEWDPKAPVDQYTIHYSKNQIDHLWQSAMRDNALASTNLKISKHDALLAHIWSCVVRARGLQDDVGIVHCDLVLGVRPALQLADSFVGSPTMMLNIGMSASAVASGKAQGATARCIRETVSTVNIKERLAAHLHSVAFEKSPQRIWQGFLGRRHIMVTTWARAGIYDIDFGLGSRIRYADGVVPCVDGCILIINSPPGENTPASGPSSRGWTDYGVDVTVPLRCEDMKRLLEDPWLLP